MKTLMTAGKGGTGKTTALACLLTRHILKETGHVLVVDADPHQCLTSLLAQAYALTPAPPLGDLRGENNARLRSGEDLGDARRSELAEALALEALTPLPGGHALLVMGANDQPGCQCVVNGLLGYALDVLAGQYDLVVVDNEAGLEPIGRHAWPVDVLLLAATPRALDLQIALRILEHAKTVGREVHKTILALNYLKDGLALPIPLALHGRLGTDIQLLAGLPETTDPEHDPAWLEAIGTLYLACRDMGLA